MNFLTLIDYIGTFAFAISGIRLASAKRFDWFGAYVVGFVTAVGGGTIRDLLLDVTPFWMLQSSYLIVTALALGFVILFGRYVIRLNNTFFIFDAIGLGLFAVVGIEKSITYGYPMWVGLIMGTLTGAAGGVLRDTLINEVPLIFRKDLCPGLCVRWLGLLSLSVFRFKFDTDTDHRGCFCHPDPDSGCKVSHQSA